MAKLPAIDEKGDLVKTKFASKNTDNGVLTVTFGNGTVLTCALDDIPAELHRDLAMHGLSQMVGDSYASAKGDYAFATEQAQKKIDALLGGQLSQSRGSGESKPRVGELAKAVAKFKDLTEDAALELLGKLDEEKKKAVRNHPGIKAIIAEMRAASAKAAAEKAADLVI